MSTVDGQVIITGSFIYDYAAEQLKLTNERRSAADVSPLVMNKQLQEAAM